MTATPSRASDAGPEPRVVANDWADEMIEAESSAWYARQFGADRPAAVLRMLRLAAIEECIARAQRAKELLP